MRSPWPADSTRRVVSCLATRKAVSQVRDVVVEALDPIEIILFGSVAQTASGNDLDLVVVTEDGDGAPRNIGLVS